MVIDMRTGTSGVNILNSYEQLALLRQPNPKAPTGLRNLCLLTLMLKTGLRVKEIKNLQEKNIDWVNGIITVEGVGGAGTRMVWVGEAEIQLLQQWRQVKPHGSPYFFSTLSGNRLKDRYIRQMVKRLSRKAGLDKDVYPNLLRYTFAAEFIRDTNDLKLLQKALGHSDIASTKSFCKHLITGYDQPVSSRTSSRRSGLPYLGNEQIFFTVTTKNHDPKGLNETGKKAKGPGEDKTNKAFIGIICNREDDDSNTEPVISMVNDEDESNRGTAIPPLKCSQCNYILRYKTNCPKCGTSFNAVLKHWGRNV